MTIKAVTKPVFPHRCRLVIGTILLLSGTSSQVRAEDCVKAKEYYTQGTEIINYEERKAVFQKAVDLCTSYAEAHVNLADALENLSDFDNAERHYREALRINENFTTPYIGLGEVYLKTGRYRLADEAFHKGLEIDPNDERLQAGRVVAAERLRREKGFYDSGQIKDCLLADEDFRLMCMCPVDHYSFLRRWICMPPLVFGSGSRFLAPQMKLQLDQIGKAMKTKELAGKRWIIIGHSDVLGNQTTNLRLSEQRASAVSDYLVRNVGVDPEILQTKFFGQNRPRASNSILEGRSENRRVEIVLDE